MFEGASSVSILGLDFAVVRSPGVSREALADGMIDHDSQTITLYDGLSGPKADQVLLHEVVHGVLDQLGYSEQSEDERLVQGLAVGLHQAVLSLLADHDIRAVRL